MNTSALGHRLTEDLTYRILEKNDKTVEIEFREKGKNSYTKEYDYVDTEEIYKKIDNKERINLDECYIEDFSLSEYRSSRNIDLYEPIYINTFNAEDAFFTSVSGIYFNFSNAIFGKGGVNFARTNFGKGDVSFFDTIFEDGNVCFMDTNFGDGNVVFSHSVFKNGNVFYACSKFGKGNIEFNYTNFGNGNVSFSGTEFENGDVDFSYTNFGKGNVFFSDTNVGKGNVVFVETNFGKGNVTFSDTYFKNGNITFSGTQFREGDIDFNDAIFQNGKIIFSDVIFKNVNISFLNMDLLNTYLKFQKCVFKGDIDFRLKSCKKLILEDVTNEKTMNFRFKKNNSIENFEFENLINYGRIEIDWEQAELKSLINKQNSTYKEKASQFLVLKQNFNTLGQYDDEDKVYVEYRRCQRKDNFENKKYFKWFGLWLFDLIGEYGTNPWRVAASMLGTVFIFAMIYVIFPNILNQETINVANEFIISQKSKLIYDEVVVLGRFWTSLQHSIVTFLTIGYGNTYPVCVGGLIICGIEGFLGVFLMSFFTVAVTRKILR